ncbi:DUF1266 domain-containing protein [Corynebacterium lubricantis]|uniref:DUF1266 domain-containing protein n=1 Tax=Corynebacterium lubricantis TaxID=541095 RepID=UPI00036FCAF1|nr:DUF1266 domain-containing protein [Corynebacterium lubricantis]
MQPVPEFVRERGLRTFDEFMNYDVGSIRSYRLIMPDTLRYSAEPNDKTGFGFALGFPEATQGFKRTVNAPESLSGITGLKQRRQLKGLLRDAWDIHDEADYNRAFEFLLSGQDTGTEELGEALSSSSMRKHCDPTGVLLPSPLPTSLEAWTLRRIASLAYIGGSLGWANVDELAAPMAQVGQRARDHYTSWRGFNEAYHCALVMHSEGGHVAWMNMLYLNYFERQDTSPWVVLPFADTAKA